MIGMRKPSLPLQSVLMCIIGHCIVIDQFPSLTQIPNYNVNITFLLISINEACPYFFQHIFLYLSGDRHHQSS